MEPLESGVKQVAFQAALGLGLPLVANHLARTSTAQSLTSLGLLGHPWQHKAWVDSLSDPRPLLLVQVRNATLSLEEQRLLRQAEFLHRSEEVGYYRLPLRALRPQLPPGPDSPVRVQPSLQGMWSHPGLAAVRTFRDTTVITPERPWVWALTPQSDSVEVSVWVRVGGEHPFPPELVLRDVSGTLLARLDPRKSFDTHGARAVRVEVVLAQLPTSLTWQVAQGTATGFRGMVRPLGEQVWTVQDGKRIGINNFFSTNSSP